MTFDDVTRFVQEHFTDGLVLIIGSGLSVAEGIPGMPALTGYLRSESSELTGEDGALWSRIELVLSSGAGLEAALLKHAPSDLMEAWIAKKTCELLLPEEQKIISEVVTGKRSLRLTTFLSKVLKPANGLPILTPNYDRLIEVACEMAGMHVDTTAVGVYSGEFDHERSCMGSCRGVLSRGKSVALDHFPRGIVLKPHGSFDWYRNGGSAIRSCLELPAERLIITPGLNKYKAGYGIPFDKHRELANNFINQSARLLVIGYGFNDDHLQTHLVNRIQGGTPTLILTRTASDQAQKLAREAPNCVCLTKPPALDGTSVLTNGWSFDRRGSNLWDIRVLTEEVLA